jgi:hypothetical protein
MAYPINQLGGTGVEAGVPAPVGRLQVGMAPNGI